MNNTTKLAGVGLVACAACCAAPLLTLAGAGAVVGATPFWGPLAFLVAMTLATLSLLQRRKVVANQSKSALPSSDHCGCGTCSTDDRSDVPTACTVDSGDFKTCTAQVDKLHPSDLRRMNEALG